LKIGLVIGRNEKPITSYITYAEVWSYNTATKKETPICWISGYQDVESTLGFKYVPIYLNLEWFRLHPDFNDLSVSTVILKNVWLQEDQGFIPISTLEKIHVIVPKEFESTVRNLPAINGISQEMLFGPIPESLLVNNNTNAKSGVVVVHGYCAKDNPFQKYTAEWTFGYFFQDFKQNRLNMKFSEQVIAFAAQQGLTSYGLVGHSQGGIVALNIINFFNSGTDLAKGERLVQSLGTPFLGNTGAGTAADLIKIFGFSCGSNSDLTTDGSALWLSGISAASKAKVYYYTTSYTKFPYCNFATNLILTKPNDGTAEIKYCALKGANDLGNTDGWCHSDGMFKTAQCYDRSRNAILNSKAAK